MDDITSKYLGQIQRWAGEHNAETSDHRRALQEIDSLCEEWRRAIEQNEKDRETLNG